MPQEFSQIPPGRQDAIHRAVLSGLLANIGARGEGHEYLGPSGKRFHLFPGSTLFRRKPSWVMAAELVETNRLYARTVAPIHPNWIERAAAHLVRRSYLDPHWRPDLGKVLAYEQVTFRGLVLVPRRRIHYGPIDPQLSREIFIHHALVLGEYETNAPYFTHNHELVKQVEAVEARLRRRDVLVEPRARFAFYDRRIPRRVYTAREFERWRRCAEQQNPRILFMSRQHLMLHPAMGATRELYPERIDVKGMSFPLEYRYEPGHRADGITVTIALSELNRIDAAPFEWLVPGFHGELFATLIRSLPRPLRIRFVPVPRVAELAAQELSPGNGSVLSSLAHYLGKTSGEPVAVKDFVPDALPEYLKMNFRVVDSGGREVAMGRDLASLGQRLAEQARKRIAAAPPPRFHRDGLLRWDFGDLPQQIEINDQGLAVSAYPALVDAIDSVSLRLFESPDAAEMAMRGGLRRLFMLQLSKEMTQIRQHLPQFARRELAQDFLETIADRAFFGDELNKSIRTQEHFAAQARAGWARLMEAAEQVGELAATTLSLHEELETSLSRDFPPMWAQSIADMRGQLQNLVHSGFLLQTPFVWLTEMPRYLRGIELRLKKLADAGLSRDLANMAQITPLLDEYGTRAQAMNASADPRLTEFRWLTEELRISLFAQELKTTVSISVQRLRCVLDQLKR